MKRSNWDRGSSGARGYGAAWRKTRDRILQAFPLCRTCFARGVITPATQVDHIIPKAKGGTDAEDNLAPICKACHAAKTQAESNGQEWSGAVKGCDEHGNPLAAHSHWK